MNTTMKQLGALTAAALLLVGAGAPATAAEPAWEVVLDAGQVCSFPLRVAGWGDGHTVEKEFVAKDGTVRTRVAGTGDSLTFTDLAGGATFSTRSNGAVNRTTIHPDGSATLSLTGHNAVLLFPTDTDGPSATLHTGQVVVDVTADGVWTVVKATGKQLDLCAQLAG